MWNFPPRRNARGYAVLGFIPQDGTSGVYLKTYSSHNAYPIYVDYNEEKIEYSHTGIKSIRIEEQEAKIAQLRERLNDLKAAEAGVLQKYL